jgi:hypothetical protein
VQWAQRHTYRKICTADWFRWLCTWRHLCMSSSSLQDNSVLAAFTVVPDIVRCVQLAIAPECRQRRLLPFLHPQPLSRRKHTRSKIFQIEIQLRSRLCMHRAATQNQHAAHQCPVFWRIRVMCTLGAASHTFVVITPQRSLRGPGCVRVCIRMSSSRRICSCGPK